MTLPGEPVSIAAYCVDGCVLWYGITLENALSETVEVGFGNSKRREAKYTLADLLDPEFRLPRKPPVPRRVQQPNGLAALMAMAGQRGSGIGAYKYVGPGKEH